jgi:putative membrane protein
MGWLIRFMLSGLAVFLTAYLLPGVYVKNYGYALVVAAVLSLVNLIVKPILIILTIPLTVLTLGLFLLVINAVVIMITDSMIPDFKVDGFWWALAFSLILSVTNSFFSDLTEEKRNE